MWLVLELCDGGSLQEVVEIMKEHNESFREDEIKAIVAYRLFFVCYCLINFHFKFSDKINTSELL